MIKICHITCLHENDDTRIFLKECVSLAKCHEYDVYQVAPGTTQYVRGVHCLGIEKVNGNRVYRMIKSSRLAYKKALSINANVYHFHDPILLPYGVKLKKRGKIVIFDSHEDVPASILDKTWIPKPFRKMISASYKAYETHAVSKFDLVIAATQHIHQQFEGRAKKAAVIYNYPLLDDIVYHEDSFVNRGKNICYAGGISLLRGSKVMSEAIGQCDGKLLVAGKADKESEPYLSLKHVEYLGVLPHEQINELYGKCRAGIFACQPAHNYIDSVPIKIFEYMAAGLPVITSNFPLLRSISNKITVVTV